MIPHGFHALLEYAFEVFGTENRLYQCMNEPTRVDPTFKKHIQVSYRPADETANAYVFAYVMWDENADSLRPTHRIIDAIKED